MRPMLICSLLAGSAFFPLQITAPPDDTPPPRADEVFVDTWSSMWDLETITYVKIAQTNIPEMTSGTTMQVGSYEASTDTGLGSFVLVADNVADELTAMPMPVTGDTTFDEALELIGGQQFTYRLVDGTFWQGIPGPGGREWFGIAVADVPIDVTAVFDGRLLLDAALASTDIAVSGRTTSAVDGGTDWVLGVDADLVLQRVAWGQPRATHCAIRCAMAASGFEGRGRRSQAPLWPPRGISDPDIATL